MVDEKDDDGASDCGDDASHIKVIWSAKTGLGATPSTDDGTKRTKERHPSPAAMVIGCQDASGTCARQQAEEYPGDQSHGVSLRRLGLR